MNKDQLNVVILGYARSDTFEKVLRSCEKYLKSIKVVLDFPANDFIKKEQQKIINTLRGTKIEYELRQRPENYGLVKSVITTISEELQKEDHIVLLEDDCVPSEEFFNFMAESLEKYKNNDNIATICGTRTRCKFNPWGWATWKNKWNYHQMTKEEVLKIKNLDKSLLDFLKQNDMEDAIWSLSWLAYLYKNNLTSLYPAKNTVKNIGFENKNSIHSSEKGYTKWLLSQVLTD